MRKLVQWWKKCILDSISLPHLHKGFKVSWKQYLNSCSWRWIRPRRNLVKSLIPRGLWISKILLAQGCRKFRSFYSKVLRLAEFLMSRSSLFHSVISERKKSFWNNHSYFYWRDVIAKPGIVNPAKIRY